MKLEDVFSEKELKLIEKVSEYLYSENKIPDPSIKSTIRFAVLDFLVPLVIKHMEVKYERGRIHEG